MLRHHGLRALDHGEAPNALGGAALHLHQVDQQAAVRRCRHGGLIMVVFNASRARMEPEARFEDTKVRNAAGSSKMERQIQSAWQGMPYN